MNSRKDEGALIYKVNDHPKASGYINDLNNHQIKILLKLKEKILNERLLEDFSIYDDITLLKFLRMKKFDLDKTYQMFSEFIKWRLKENIDEIEHMRFEELPEIRKLYPHGYHKTDKSGRPIYIELLGEVKINELFKLATDDRLLKYYTREYERAKYRYNACSKAYGKLVEDAISILDMKGISMGVFKGKVKKIFTMSSHLGENYYPDNNVKSFLINTSTMFSLLWSLIKGFLSEKTRSRTVVLKNNYKDVLLEQIDRNSLPSFFGGSCTCSHIPGGCLLSDIGPWNPEGGLLDENN